MLSLAGRVCRSSSHLLAQSNMPSHHARDLLELSCADTHCHRDKDHRHTLFALTTSTLDICIVHSFAPVPLPSYIAARGIPLWVHVCDQDFSPFPARYAVRLIAMVLFLSLIC